MKTLKPISMYPVDDGKPTMISFCPEENAFIATRIAYKRDSAGKVIGYELAGDNVIKAETVDVLLQCINYYIERGEF